MKKYFKILAVSSWFLVFLFLPSINSKITTTNAEDYCAAGVCDPGNPGFDMCGVYDPVSCSTACTPDPSQLSCTGLCYVDGHQDCRDNCGNYVSSPCTPTTPPPPPGPQCGSNCVYSSDCASGDALRDSCTQCINGQCQQQVQPPPPVAPPPPPGPYCNSSCTRASDCTGDAARNNCTACLPDLQGQLTCQPAEQCGSPCTTNTNCSQAADGCTQCNTTTHQCQRPNNPPPPACPGNQSNPHAECRNGQCQLVNTCGTNSCAVGSQSCQVAPPPPPANTNVICKCDGIDHSVILPGQKATITAFAKVEGSDVGKSQVTGMKFLFLPAIPGYNQVIANATQPATVVSNSSSLVRYQSIWNIDIPANLQPNVPYRIQSTPICQPITNNVSYVNTQPNVLGATTQKTASFWDNLVNFIRNLFSPTTSTTQTITSPSQNQTTPPNNNPQLQLKTITPARIIDQQCESIQFQFDNP